MPSLFLLVTRIGDDKSDGTEAVSPMKNGTSAKGTGPCGPLRDLPPGIPVAEANLRGRPTQRGQLGDLTPTKLYYTRSYYTRSGTGH